MDAVHTAGPERHNARSLTSEFCTPHC